MKVAYIYWKPIINADQGDVKILSNAPSDEERIAIAQEWLERGMIDDEFNVGAVVIREYEDPPDPQ